MSRMRLSVNERAELVRRDGTVVGSIVGISVDLDLEAWGVGGEVVDFDVSSKTELQPPTPTAGEQTAMMPNPATQVWEHYQRTVAFANRRNLDSTRLSCIRRALKVRSVDECCKAIDALAASEWHNGANPGERRYTDIQYALGQKGESADERIDKMIGRTQTDNQRSTVDALLSRLPSDARPMVRSWMNDVQDMLRSPNHAGLRATGESRLRDLRERTHIEPVIEGDRIVEWRRVDG